MAEATELTELPPAPKRPGRVAWDDVLDGRVWKLVCGVDFENEDGKTVRSTARREARQRGVEVETRPPVKEGRRTIVYLQAVRTPARGGGKGHSNSESPSSLVASGA